MSEVDNFQCSYLALINQHRTIKKQQANMSQLEESSMTTLDSFELQGPTLWCIKTEVTCKLRNKIRS